MSFHSFLTRFWGGRDRGATQLEKVEGESLVAQIDRARVQAALDDLQAHCDSMTARIASLEQQDRPKELPMDLKIEVAPGELIDRLSILEIKLERINDPGKQSNIRREYEMTLVQRRKLGDSNPQLEILAAELKAVNETIWDIEDKIRDYERNRIFDENFISVARSVYQANDKRAEIKRDINKLLRSNLIEEKSYAPY